MTNTTTVLDSILSVFTGIGDWIASAVTAITPMFYDGSSLTFLGVLAIAGLGFSTIFMVMGLITNFLNFRS